MPIGNNIIAGASAATDSKYHIENSLRFDRGPSLFRSFTSTNTYTFSCWIKPAYDVDNRTNQYSIIGGDNCYVHLEDDILHFRQGTNNIGTVGNYRLRDKTGWYHIVVNQTGGSVNSKVWVNGQEATDSGGDTRSVDNIMVGARNSAGDLAFEGYMAELFFIYGTSRPPTDFGENVNGVWIPKDLASELTANDYGAEGGYYKFNNRTNIGEDSSGNGNTLSVQGTFTNDSSTAYDNMVLCLDTPTNNFAQMDMTCAEPRSTFTFDKAGARLNTHDGVTFGSIPLRSGKWYWECLSPGGSGDNSKINTGIFDRHLVRNVNAQGDGQGGANNPTGYGGSQYFDYHGDGHVRKNGSDGQSSSSSGISGISAGDFMMVAFDVDARKIWFGKNGSWFNSGDPAAGTNETFGNSSIRALSTNNEEDDYWLPFASGQHTTNLMMSFGQHYVHNSNAANIEREADPSKPSGAYNFKHEPPTGFKAICTKNLPDVAITNPRKHFAVVEYDANNGTAQTISSLEFQPDLIWFKSEGTSPTVVWDCTRGNGVHTTWNNVSQTTDATIITGITSTGFTLGADSTNSRKVNSGTDKVQAMCWKAGGKPTVDNDNTSGAMDDGSVFKDGAVVNSFTPTGSPSHYPQMISINSVAKMSIVKYQGTGASATIPHGLEKRPSLIIFKNHSIGDEWTMWHARAAANSRLDLSNRFTGVSDSYFQSSNTDEHHFGVGSDGIGNGNGHTITAYCFANVTGFFCGGDYNGQDDGGLNGFVDARKLNLGFRPSFWFFKRKDGAVDPLMFNLEMNDRSGMFESCFAMNNEDSAAKLTSTSNAIDVLAGGFKFRNSSPDMIDDGSSEQWLFGAWADVPHGGANVSPANAL